MSPLWLLRPHAPGDIKPRDPEVRRFDGSNYFPPQAAYGWSRAFVIHRIRAGLACAEVLADDLEKARARRDGIIFDLQNKAHVFG